MGWFPTDPDEEYRAICEGASMRTVKRDLSHRERAWIRLGKTLIAFGTLALVLWLVVEFVKRHAR